MFTRCAPWYADTAAQVSQHPTRPASSKVWQNVKTTPSSLKRLAVAPRATAGFLISREEMNGLNSQSTCWWLQTAQPRRAAVKDIRVACLGDPLEDVQDLSGLKASSHDRATTLREPASPSSLQEGVFPWLRNEELWHRLMQLVASCYLTK